MYRSSTQQKVKLKLVAFIREAECIGCTKCIEACPVDAILGSNKHMHTVITTECIGCKLCVAPCPVDCVDLLVLPNEKEDPIAKKQRADSIKNRFRARKKRLAHTENNNNLYADKKTYIAEAILRTKAKKIKPI